MVLKFQHAVSTPRHSPPPSSKLAITSPARSTGLPPQSPLQERTGRFINKLQLLVLNHRNIAALALGVFERVLDRFYEP